tara:strand:+ start:17855 stop:18448 length:594 start_codon:yes stop_codon:yes gene_type:complete
MHRCFRKRTKRQIGEYINELKDLDNTLEVMCHRIEADIRKTSQEQKITKHTLQRRLLLKRHYKSVDQRRVQILGRILQLENLHLNGMQINALKHVSKAHKEIAVNPEDVEELLDKLSVFTDDFNEISERLAEDLTFNTDITDEELEKELNSELEYSSVLQSISELPQINVLQHPQERDVQRSVSTKIQQQVTSATDA